MSTVQDLGKIVTNGLVLYLDAANYKSYISGSTVWNDLSGNANNGTLTNGPTYDATNAGSIVFDGVNDWVSVSHSNSLNTVTVTVSLWFKANSLGGNKVLISKGSSYGNRTYWFYEDSGIQFSYRGTFTSKIPSAQITDGRWHNTIGTYNGSVLSLYLDGILFNSVSVVTSTTNLLPIGINAYSDGGYVAAAKNISNVLIYNRALSPQEITQNYNALKSRFGLT